MEPEEDYEQIDEFLPPKRELAAQPQKRSAPPVPKRKSMSDINHPATAQKPQHIRKASQPTLAPQSVQIGTSSSQSVCPERLSLSEFGTKYAKALPLRITVCGGFYGQSDRTTLSGGEMFNIHFIKHTKVVTMKDQRGMPFTVPMHSAIQFGLIYDPFNDNSSAMPFNDNSSAMLKGFQFKKVSDILRMPVLPKVICATKSSYSPKPENSVQANEVFVVRGSIHHEGRKTCLKVYSMATRREKYLYELCAGNFITLPQSIGLYLPELVAQVQELFPAKAVLIMGKGSTVEIPSHLSGFVQLLGSKTETSFVATNALEGNAKNAPLTDIPADLSVDVEVILPQVSKTQQLYEDTKFLYENFKLANVLSLKRPINHKVQSFIDTTVQTSEESTGINVIKPEAAYANADPGPAHGRERSATQSASPLQASSVVHKRTQQRGNDHVVARPTRQDLDSPMASSINKQGKVDNLRQDVSEMKAIMEKLVQESDSLKQTCQALEAKVARLEAQVKTGFTELQTESTAECATSAMNQEKNKQFISTLNHLQVCFFDVLVNLCIMALIL